jgi:pimeloyl-ACP methyl ester carboxylesterase
MDFRGHGKTDLGPFEKLTFNQFADDIIALLDHLMIKSAIIGGISMGAGVALNLAIRYPERLTALILIRAVSINQSMENPARQMFTSIYHLISDYGRLRGSEIFLTADIFCKETAVASSLLAHFHNGEVKKHV